MPSVKPWPERQTKEGNMSTEDLKGQMDAGDTLITEDNIMASKERYRAIEAMKNGTATPQQAALVMDTDRVMKEALELRRK